MTKFKSVLAGLLMMGAATPALAVDYTAMREDKRIHSELLGAAVANVIDEKCEALGLRKFRIFNKAMALQSHARTLGYSFGEIKGYVDSKVEQARFRKMAEAELAKRGARKGDNETYCAAGRVEIKKGTFIGKLLYE